MKERHVLMNAKNFKNDITLHGSVFQFGHKGSKNPVFYGHSWQTRVFFHYIKIEDKLVDNMCHQLKEHVT